MTYPCVNLDVIDRRHLERQREFSLRTFGPGQRLAGVLDHIRKELKEVETSPDDVTEWADLIILAFDGAMRSGHDPQQIIHAIKGKQAKNEQREWPDWRTQDPDKAIEHVRSLTPHPLTAKEFETVYDQDRTFALVEDEDASGVYGYGHRDKAEFAALVNDYDQYCGGDGSSCYTESDVAHSFAFPVSDERFRFCGPDRPGAVPITRVTR